MYEPLAQRGGRARTDKGRMSLEVELDELGERELRDGLGAGSGGARSSRGSAASRRSWTGTCRRCAARRRRRSSEAATSRTGACGRGRVGSLASRGPPRFGSRRATGCVTRPTLPGRRLQRGGRGSFGCVTALGRPRPPLLAARPTPRPRRAGSATVHARCRSGRGVARVGQSRLGGRFFGNVGVHRIVCNRNGASTRAPSTTFSGRCWPNRG
jgi:hypothetical protein